MTQPHVVIDTNCLLQILGAKSKYHFLFDSFLQFGYVLCIYIVTNDNHFQEAADSPFLNFNVISLDDFADLMKQQ